MPEQGVQFTKPAADRIANTVRSVEGRPFPPGGLQRRRSGGGSRPTLWEIVSIQTGTETCTIRRVENQAGDLVAASEKTDILYDTENPPNTGDRGLLIRLAEGSLFFFSPGRALNRINMVSACYVDNLNPDTGGLGYSKFPILYRKKISSSVTEQWQGVFKFDRRCPPEPTPGDKQITLHFPITLSGLESYWPTGGDEAEIIVRIYGIMDDFDPATLTWNQLQALNTWFITTAPFMEYMSQPYGPRTSYAIWTPRAWGPRMGWYVGESSMAGGLQLLFEKEVYGVYAEIQLLGTERIDSWTRMRMELIDYEDVTAWNGFLEWFE